MAVGHFGQVLEKVMGRYVTMNVGMASLDFLYVALGSGFLILVGCFVAITLQLLKIMSDVKSVSEDVAGVATDLTMLKDGIKTTGLTLIQSLLEKAKKGGRKKDDD